MFVTYDQPRSVIVCLFIGVVCGVLYEVFYTLKFIFNNKLLNHFLNFIFFICSAFIFTLLTCYFSLGNFRVYMAVFFMIGLILYLNTFHKIIAFFVSLVAGFAVAGITEILQLPIFTAGRYCSFNDVILDFDGLL